MRPLAIVTMLSVVVSAAVPVAGQQAASSPDTTYTPSRCGVAPTPPAADTIDRAVLAWMRRSRTPAASIAIVRRGHVTERTYGWADLVNCVPATSEMCFGIGSISKQITAIGALVLVQEGKLALEDPISRWLPESGESWRGITVRHLLTHTSGIRDSGHDDEVYPQIELDKKQDVSEQELIASLAAAPRNFPAGEGWAYSNTGYLLLSIIIQRAGGAPYPIWMREHVFAPLGMRATRYYDVTEIVPALARGYTIDRDGHLRPGRYASSSYSHWGDMGIVSTAHDMALWSAELDSSRLISPALHRVMLAPARLRDGATFPYGFGVILDDYRGEPVLRHSGTYSTGYSADLVVMPARGLRVVILTNQHQGNPWGLSGILRGLLDSTLKPLSSLHAERDRAPERTRRVAALLNGDSTAAAATPAWRRLMYPQIRGFISELLPLTVDYLACDDVASRQIERFGATADRECYYRLRHGPVDMVLGVLYTRDERIMGMLPRP
jgi:CubicO group peptidase (beta-lactamase class C family)